MNASFICFYMKRYLMRLYYFHWIFYQLKQIFLWVRYIRLPQFPAQRRLYYFSRQYLVIYNCGPLLLYFFNRTTSFQILSYLACPILSLFFPPSLMCLVYYEFSNYSMYLFHNSILLFLTIMLY